MSATSAEAGPTAAKGRGEYRIGKSFAFEAAHRLGGLPERHKCARVHGHSYTVEVTLVAHVLSGPGFVVDFADLEPVKQYLADTFDHRLINEAIAVEPTSENLSRLIFDWCAERLPLPDGVCIEAVRVSETATSWAEYRIPVCAGRESR
ncbi:6-carboxytetrahydropterin synthase QueD [Micromonospora sp. NPDC050980]|uniref:6-carboxytetrahydropterin synthase QueD n=1 Tax=Micromonospora sp. NPDC050980 TaxID=3155161 RepID=UPI0033FC98BB